MTTPETPQPRLDYFDLIRQFRAGGVTALARTISPYIVGSAAALAARRWGIVVPEDLAAELTLLLALTIGSVYYEVVRLIERRWPAVGRWLLGLGARQKPVYTEPEVAAEVTQTSPPATARPETP